MENFMLQTKDLSKKYGSFVALDNINMNIKEGSIYGFIGKNGAGKSTCLKIISGLAKETKGEVIFNTKSGNTIKVGNLIENPGIMGNLSAYDNLKMKCVLFNKNNKAYINSLLDLVGLNNVGKKPVKKFSLGMKQRLGIALALIGEPELLILDEPINGLDPEGIKEVRNTIINLNKNRGLTIIISSHILEELSKIATDYGIINRGKLIKECSSTELFSSMKSKIIIESDNADILVDALKNLGYSDVEKIDNRIVYVYDKDVDTNLLNKNLVNIDISVHSIIKSTENIDDYFLSLVGGN